MSRSSDLRQTASINICLEVIWRIPSSTRACVNHAGQQHWPAKDLLHKALGGLCNVLRIKLMALSVGPTLHNERAPTSSLQNLSTFQVHSKIPTGICQGRALLSLAVFLTNIWIQISPVNRWVVLFIRHKSHHFFPCPLTLQSPHYLRYEISEVLCFTNHLA